MKLVKIFVEKRTLQEEITMKNKLKKSTLLRVSVNHVFNNSSNGVNKKL